MMRQRHGGPLLDGFGSNPCPTHEPPDPVLANTNTMFLPKQNVSDTEPAVGLAMDYPVFAMRTRLVASRALSGRPLQA